MTPVAYLPSPLDAVADMRATAKWLLGALGAVGAALVGGSPLVGIGRVHGIADALLAGGGLLAVLVGVGTAVWQTSRVLEPTVVTVADLSGKRLRELVARIDAAPEEYFGTAATSVANLLMHRGVAARLHRAHEAEKDVRRKRALAHNLSRAQTNVERTDPYVKWLLALAHAEQVRFALRRARRWTVVGGVLLVAGVVAFLVATGGAAKP